MAEKNELAKGSISSRKITRKGPWKNSVQISLLTSVSALALGFIACLHTGTTVNNGGLLDNQTIAVQLGNVAARVGQGNFIDFIGVKPNLALSALKDGSRQALLESKRDWWREKKG